MQQQLLLFRQFPVQILFTNFLPLMGVCCGRQSAEIKLFINLTLGAQGRPLGKLTLSVGGLRGGGGGGGWIMTSRSKGSTSPSMPLSASSGSSSSSFLKGSRSLYVSRLSCLTRGWEREKEKTEAFQIDTFFFTASGRKHISMSLNDCVSNMSNESSLINNTT